MNQKSYTHAPRKMMAAAIIAFGLAVFLFTGFRIYEAFDDRADEIDAAARFEDVATLSSLVQNEADARRALSAAVLTGCDESVVKFAIAAGAQADRWWWAGEQPVQRGLSLQNPVHAAFTNPECDNATRNFILSASEIDCGTVLDYPGVDDRATPLAVGCP